MAQRSHNGAGFRKLQKSGFSWLFWDFLWFFFTFCEGQFLYYKIRHIVTILYLAKSGHNENGYRKIQKSFFSWLFCDFLWSYLFLYFTSILNRLTYIGCCRTNNYQKHICFWWSNITSLILEVTQCCLCPGADWAYKEVRFCPRAHPCLVTLKQSGTPRCNFFGGPLEKKFPPRFGGISFF
jgi:hypothetical protein